MKIGIIDTDHYFYIYTLIQLFENSDTEITIYTNQKVFKRCEVDLAGRKDIKYVVQETGESWSHFLDRNIDSINSAGFNYFFICPLYQDYKANYKFVSKLKTLTILVVFNLNGWINPLFKNLRHFLRSWYRHQIIKKVKWITIDEHYHDQAIKLGCKNKILHIPCLLYDPAFVAKYRADKPPVKIIIPGTIDPDRRDYHVLMDALEVVLNQRQDFEIVLLGNPIAEYGKQIHDKAKKINEKYGKQIFKIFENKYTDREFLNEMVSGHFLIAPLLPEFNLDGIVEIYGISKSTGSCFDILAFAIPGVFPHWLSVNARFNSSILRYKNSTDISNIILDFLEHPEKIEKLRANALINSAYYSVENVRERLMETLRLSETTSNKT